MSHGSAFQLGVILMPDIWPLHDLGKELGLLGADSGVDFETD